MIDHNQGFPNRNHLKYIKKFNIEFQRTPAIDEMCNSHTTSTIQEIRQFDYCRSSIMDNNSKIVAVIGDSHAHVLYPGIAEIAKKHGYNSILLANSSCPPLKSLMWGRNQEEIDNCQKKIKQILKFLEQEKRVEKVVIATRGPVYIHGEVKGKITENSVNASLHNFRYPNRITYKTYFIGFENTIKQLSSINHIKNIYYYLENPELDFLPKEVIPRPFDYFGISTQGSTTSRSLYELRMSKYREMAIKISSNFHNVTIIDMMPYMCDDNQCFAYLGGNFLYADDDHLSVFGSHYIAEKTEEILFGN